MNNKNIIIAGAIAIGLYLFSQTKKIGKKVAQRTRSTATPAVRQRTAQKITQKVAPKRIGQPTTWAAHIAALRKAAAQRAAARKATAQRAAAQRAAARKATAQRAAAQRAAARKATAQRAAARKATAQRAAARKATAQKVAQKKVASWKAPYKFPNSTFRVITPSDILRNLAKKNIARKKAEQQKTAQKTTPDTPSARRKKRLEALYGSHWHDIWVERQKR